MNRANATLFAAFFHFDTSFMVWVILGPLALFIAKDLDLSTTQKAFLVSIPPLERFGKEIGIVTGIVGAAGGIGGFYLPNLLGLLRAASGTFASGFITFGVLALVGAVFITIRGRIWSATFLRRISRSYAFAIEEG